MQNKVKFKIKYETELYNNCITKLTNFNNFKLSLFPSYFNNFGILYVEKNFCSEIEEQLVNTLTAQCEVSRKGIANAITVKVYVQHEEPIVFTLHLRSEYFKTIYLSVDLTLNDIIFLILLFSYFSTFRYNKVDYAYE